MLSSPPDLADLDAARNAVVAALVHAVAQESIRLSVRLQDSRDAPSRFAEEDVPDNRTPVLFADVDGEGVGHLFLLLLPIENELVRTVAGEEQDPGTEDRAP